ncbi:MAG TPA: hypothetical protein VK530_16060 [Candidatus Acidoferrum sp.]|nr:hypothetical protein [Candidatus Acidoferrum sp.]
MPKDLDDLRERKEELLLESEINRQILELECGQIRLKAVEWRRGLTKAGSIYKWIAPVAGIAMGFFAAKKQVQRAQSHGRGLGSARHNGHGGFNLNLMGLLAPLGATALKQGFQFWRHARRKARDKE